MNGSKDIDEEKCDELCATSALRIDSKDLLKDESCTQDFSRLHPKAVDLSAEWQLQMDKIAEVLILNM